jgi:hypothetical protein
LQPFLAPDNFKSYEELNEKLSRVISGAKAAETVENTDLPQATESAPVPTQSATPMASDTDEDDSLGYFSKLAQE